MDIYVQIYVKPTKKQSRSVKRSTFDLVLLPVNHVGVSETDV